VAGAVGFGLRVGGSQEHDSTRKDTKLRDHRLLVETPEFLKLLVSHKRAMSFRSADNKFQIERDYEHARN